MKPVFWGVYKFMPKKKKHNDTRVSLHPLSFREAIKKLAHSPRHEDSGVEGTGNTKEHAPESGSSKSRNAPHPKSSDD